MITDKVKALFQFIQYLYSNIGNFNKFNDLIIELNSLINERAKLNPRSNYKDKQEYDKVQAEIERKFEVLQKNTAKLILSKAAELKVCNFERNNIYRVVDFNGVQEEIQKLKENFSTKDLPKISKHKRQYLEYRNSTHKTFLSLEMFFEDLDEITKGLFDFFKDTKQNEFEPFETKVIPVSSIAEAVKQLSEGKRKFILPIDAFDTEQENEFTLPNIIVQDLERVKDQVQRFGSRFEKINFLNRLIEQTNIDKVIALWDKDCLKCVEQFKYKPAWEGVFDALHGDFKFETAINELAYEAGVQHYKNYILLKELLEIMTNDKELPPRQTDTITEQGTATFINNFDNTEPTKIYKHFKEGLVDKGYLTERELNEYFKAAFELQTIAKELFKLKHTPVKQKIYTVFYVYYKDIAGKKHYQQTKYAELLGNYFEGYKTTIIRTNWARGYKTKR